MFKLLIKISMIFTIVIFFTSCIANSYTGTIDIQNTSNIDAKNIRIGDYFIGTVTKGQSYTYYFYNSVKNAQVTIEGVEPADVWNAFLGRWIKADGEINLKLNYKYTLNIYKDDNDDNVFRISGRQVDGNSSDTEDMK